MLCLSIYIQNFEYVNVLLNCISVFGLHQEKCIFYMYTNSNSIIQLYDELYEVCVYVIRKGNSKWDERCKRKIKWKNTFYWLKRMDLMTILVIRKCVMELRRLKWFSLKKMNVMWIYTIVNHIWCSKHSILLCKLLIPWYLIPIDVIDPNMLVYPLIKRIKLLCSYYFDI